MGSPDYNTGGFSDSGDGIFADPGNDPGSIDDYNSWDWKQIMAAINGMSAGTGSDANQERAKGISDPQSLMDAAGHFLNAEVVLAGIAKSLADQANALAGENGPWKGAAADAFCDMINTFSRQVKATADVLSGGEAGNSVPQQLADNSVNLYNAQVKIADIDAWYADQAVKMGVKPMSNGLIPIHEKPQLVEMMTSDMRAVLKSLAGEYQVTIDSVHTPPPVTSPTDSPDVPDDVPDVPDPDLTDPNLPNVDAPDPQAFSAPDTSGLPDPEMPGVNPMNALATPSPYSGGTGVDGDAPGLDGLPKDALGNDTLDPSALDKALNPSAFPGDSNLDDGLPTFSPTAFPGGLNTGTGAGKFPTLADNLAEDPASWSDTGGLPEDFPGDTGVGGTGGLNAGEGLGDVAPEQFPGGLDTESGLPEGLASPSLLDNALESPALDGLSEGEQGLGAGGMPMMPGMGAGGMPQSGAPDRSDSSGLLDSEAEPWSGDPSVADEIGGRGADAGGDGLGLPLDEAEAAGYPGGLSTEEGLTGMGAGGMPMMPGMGAGGMPQSGAPDRSDSSGLLDTEAEPWVGDPEVGEEIGGAGALAGGEGLGLPLDEEAEALPGALAAEEAEEGSALGMGGMGGMPMMPGMGAGGPAAQGTTDPSDASGLLEPEGEPWTGEPGVPEEITGGAGAGGEGLALPEPTEGVMIGSDGLPIAPRPTAAPMAPLADGEETGAAVASEAEAAEAGAVAAGEAAPAMPGMMPGAGAPSTGSRDERSDASGLLTPDAEAWTPEAEADGERPVVAAHEGVGEGALPAALLGAAAGATAAAVAGSGLGAGTAGAAEESAERRHRRRHEDDAAALIVLPAGGDDTAQQPGEGHPDEPDQPELPDGHVALAPAAEAEAEDTAAWDSAGASFVPLLWSVPTEDEEEVLAPGYATEDASTWSGEAGATAEEADGPRLSTWRPNRTGPTGPGEMVVPAVRLRSFAGDPSELTAELPPQDSALDETEAEEEPAQPSRGIADLLVQEGDTWGTAASDGSGAVL
ncbi:WXG100 family type VII secretion target [Streptomyces murinus]|uniref:WXG100 family type VII secretion target n=1 Tax=Streptomyces murinus TaxID=33900 RepID=UPI0038033B9A